MSELLRKVQLKVLNSNISDNHNSHNGNIQNNPAVEEYIDEHSHTVEVHQVIDFYIFDANVNNHSLNRSSSHCNSFDMFTVQCNTISSFYSGDGSKVNVMGYHCLAEVL